jgi:hypothetical protein
MTTKMMMGTETVLAQGGQIEWSLKRKEDADNGPVPDRRMMLC